ncbi:NAD(P)/FAD-dependent oxidoreductase [Actinoplanes sp. NPDC049265]|uniref:NAD(P)/FAD-dependent oxidoreductase n=1 Tax=Actinoplanes sp. NPDC049265 TaxID=3363902 RepID=UPI0037165CCA
MNRIVVVGASAAGLTAAEALRRAGHAGPITMIGAEPEAPYDRPPLSKQFLSGAWEADRLALRTKEHLDRLDLDLRLGTAATGLDLASRVVRLAGGEQAGFDGLIIATGVEPRRLPGQGGHVLRTRRDAEDLRGRLGPGRRLAVVGAGFLGAEAAAVARGLGCEVVLLDPAPAPLAHAVGEEVGRMLARVHREQGVDLRTGTGVAAVTDRGVLLPDGELVPADAVLVAIGSRPATGWLDGSGLDVTDGVVCDEYCAAAPGVYAAGDVARWFNPLFGAAMRVEHRTNAAEQGLAAAHNLLRPGDAKPFAPVPYFWSDQYDLKIQAYGHLPGHDSVEIAEGDLEQRRFLALYRRAGRLVGALAVGLSPRALRPWRQALGSRA